MAKPDPAFYDAFEAAQGTVLSKAVARVQGIALHVAAGRGDAALARFATQLERSPLRLAAVVDRLDDTDPMLLAALAGRRSMQDLAGVQPVGGRQPTPPTLLESVAREAAQRHWDRCRTNPEQAQRLDAVWTARRHRLRGGHLGEALDAMESTYGVACSAQSEATLGRRVTVAPPQGYVPRGGIELTGIGNERWQRINRDAATAVPWPSAWGYHAATPSRQKPFLYVARGTGRAEQLASRRFAPRVALSQPFFRMRLRWAMAKGPAATRQFLTSVANNPRRMAAALRSRLDPIVVAAAIGPNAILHTVAGRNDRYPGPLGRLYAAVHRQDTELLSSVRLDANGARPRGVTDADAARVVDGGLQGDPETQRLAEGLVQRVWKSGSRGPSSLDPSRSPLAEDLTDEGLGNVYDAWRHVRGSVAAGLTRDEIAVDAEQWIGDKAVAQAILRDARHPAFQPAPDEPPPHYWSGSEVGVRPGSTVSDVPDLRPEFSADPAAPVIVPPVPEQQAAPTASSPSPVPRAPVQSPEPGQSPPAAGTIPDQPASDGPVDGRPSDTVPPPIEAASRAQPVVDAGAPASPDPVASQKTADEPAVGDGAAPPVRKKETDPDPVPHLAGTSRQASIHVPAEALRDVAIDVSKLPKMTLLEDGSWKVHDDPYVDRVVEQPDGSYDVVLHEGISASVVVEQNAHEAASSAHKRRSDPVLIEVQNAYAEQEVADLRLAQVDSLAVQVESGRSTFDLSRDALNGTLAFNPATGTAFDGLDGQVLRSQAAALGRPADGRFATRAEIQAAGGSVLPEAKGVVVMRDVTASTHPFGEDGRVDQEAEPVRYTLRTPVVLYHVAAQTADKPRFDGGIPERPEAARDLASVDLVQSLGVRTERTGGSTRYEPPMAVADRSGKPSAVRGERVVLGDETVAAQRSRLVGAAVDAAMTVADGRPHVPPAGKPVYSRGSAQETEVERCFVRDCVADRVASRIGVAYDPDPKPDADRRREYAAILRSPNRLEKLSDEADRIASWVVDGAKTRLHDRGMRTAHEQFEDAQRAASGGRSEPARSPTDPEREPATQGR